MVDMGKGYACNPSSHKNLDSSIVLDLQVAVVQMAFCCFYFIVIGAKDMNYFASPGVTA